MSDPTHHEQHDDAQSPEAERRRQQNDGNATGLDAVQSRATGGVDHLQSRASTGPERVQPKAAAPMSFAERVVAQFRAQEPAAWLNASPLERFQAKEAAYQEQCRLVMQMHRNSLGPLQYAAQNSAPFFEADALQYAADGPAPSQQTGPKTTSDVKRVAATGLEGATPGMPYQQQIQASFGKHDISNVQSSVGGQAEKANAQLGSLAYASGDKISFRGQPDLFTAAHEAAHIVQQRAGVNLKSGIGEVGDTYEQHADAVASLVVQGKSAEALLDQKAPSTPSDSSHTSNSVQHKKPNHTPVDKEQLEESDDKEKKNCPKGPSENDSGGDRSPNIIGGPMRPGPRGKGPRGPKKHLRGDKKKKDGKILEDGEIKLEPVFNTRMRTPGDVAGAMLKDVYDQQKIILDNMSAGLRNFVDARIMANGSSKFNVLNVLKSMASEAGTAILGGITGQNSELGGVVMLVKGVVAELERQRLAVEAARDYTITAKMLLTVSQLKSKLGPEEVSSRKAALDHLQALEGEFEGGTAVTGQKGQFLQSLETIRNNALSTATKYSASHFQAQIAGAWLKEQTVGLQDAGAKFEAKVTLGSNPIATPSSPEATIVGKDAPAVANVLNLTMSTDKSTLADLEITKYVRLGIESGWAKFEYDKGNTCVSSGPASDMTAFSKLDPLYGANAPTDNIRALLSKIKKVTA